MDQLDCGLASDNQNNIGALESLFGYEFWCTDNDPNVSHQGNNIDVLISPAFVCAESTNNSTLEHQPITTLNENDISTDSSIVRSGALTVSRRRKKPKGFPKRSLSAYNIFFKEERVKVLEEFNCHRVSTPAVNEQTVERKTDRSSVSFQDLGKIIGKRWKTISDEDRRRVESLADQDNLRYHNEMDEFNGAKRKRYEEKTLRTKIDDVDDAVPSTNLYSLSKLNSMILTRPSAMYTSFHPSDINHLTADNQTMAQNWRSAENTQHGSSSARSEHLPVFSYPIPPGTDMILPDHHGVDRCYKVQYNFFRMTRREAETYMAQLAHTPTVTPFGFTDFPPPPPGATYLHNL